LARGTEKAGGGRLIKEEKSPEDKILTWTGEGEEKRGELKGEAVCEETARATERRKNRRGR